MSLSPRTRTRGVRRRSDTPSVSRTLVVGGLTIGFCVLVLYVGLTAYNGVPLRDYSTVYVEVPKIGNLITHDPVRVSGVRVGQVKSSDTRGDRARVKLQIEPGVTFPADTKVAVRSNGLLGARYVEMIPGSSTERLRSGATVRSVGDVMSNGLPETLDTLDASTRGALGSLVRSLGQGMLSRGDDINAGLRSAAEGVGPFMRLSEEVLAPSARLGELAPSLLAAMTPLDRSRRDIGRLLGPADVALRPFVDRRGQVQQTLDVAPSALRSTRSGLDAGSRLLTATRELARQAHRTLPVVPAGLDATTSALDAAPRPLDRAEALLGSAEKAVPPVLRLTRAARPVLAPLRATGGHAEPVLRGVAPYGCDVINFGINFRSMTGFAGPGTASRGPLMGFRAQVVPSPEVLSALGKIGPKGQDTSRNYDPPCTYTPVDYPLVVPRLPLNGKGR